jgi:hypothetical protein
LQPLAFQLLQCNLDGHQPHGLAVVALNRLRQKIPRLAGGHANAIKTATALGERLLHIRAKAVVHADIAGGSAPVAGGNGDAALVDQRQRRRLAGTVGLLQLVVELRHLRGVQWLAQSVAQLAVQRQHLGQRAVTVDALRQRLPIQRQLALHVVAFRL